SRWTSLRLCSRAPRTTRRSLESLSVAVARCISGGKAPDREAVPVDPACPAVARITRAGRRVAAEQNSGGRRGARGGGGGDGRGGAPRLPAFQLSGQPQ